MRSIAGRVNAARYQFFTRARLSKDEYGRICGSDFGDALSQGIHDFRRTNHLYRLTVDDWLTYTVGGGPFDGGHQIAGRCWQG